MPATASHAHVRQYIASSWHKTVRTTPDDPTHVRVPLPFTVPAIEGSFQELYYWDIYFTNRGLLPDGLLELARQNADNMLHLVDTHGFMPNGTRTAYLTRSQLPWLMMIVLDIFKVTGDRAWLRRAARSLRREYDTFTHGPHLAGSTGLSCCFDWEDNREVLLSTYPGYAARVGLPPHLPEELQIEYARHSRAECACWDYTPRFGDRCLNYAPVDLNALLYSYEKGFAEIAQHLDEPAEIDWPGRAEQRRTALDRHCWNEARGIYLDYDFVHGRQSEVASLATFQPLWAKMCDPSKAARIRASLPLFERAAGLAACETVELAGRSYQWGYPNGWAPLQLIAVEGLANYGHYTDAERVAEKFLATVSGVYRDTGKLWEKYNVIDGSLRTASEYGTPELLGWTAGVFVALEEFMRSRHSPG